MPNYTELNQLPGHLRALVNDNTIIFEQARELTDDEINALNDPDTIQMLREGTLNLEQLLGRELNPGLNRPRTTLEEVLRVFTPEQQLAIILARDVGHYRWNHLAPEIQEQPAVNASQSTHNASVHKSVSESIRKLFERYQSMIEGEKLENILSKMQESLGNLAEDSNRIQAAKRCFLRITNAPALRSFRDPSSGVTIQQLLALSFLAINDNDNRIGTLKDAYAQLVEGLYEIQRGYNLSDKGIDLNEDKPDISICSAGTVNKLIEKLNGIHPDCEVLYITHTTSALKLPIIVREEAIRHLESLATPKTSAELLTFTALIEQIKKEGIDVIWDSIKTSVAERMLDEFGCLYRNKESDPLFKEMIEAGQYTTLSELSSLQKLTSTSDGYRAYLTESLYQSNRFFPGSKPLKEEGLISKAEPEAPDSSTSLRKK